MSDRVHCPECGMERTRFDIGYCEICRYRFEAEQSNQQPVSRVSSDSTVRSGNAQEPDAQHTEDSHQKSDRSIPGGNQRWQILVVVDPSLYIDPDPDLPCPTDEPLRTFHLDLNENLVGRRSDSKRIYPEIPLADPGVSHRHCKILEENDRMFLIDLGSVNGTSLNNEQAKAGVKLQIEDGDEITLGCWTRMTVRCIQPKQ